MTRTIGMNDSVAVREMLDRLLKEINRDIDVAIRYSPEDIPYYRRDGVVSRRGVDFRIEVTVMYPGWQEYLDELQAIEERAG